MGQDTQGVAIRLTRGLFAWVDEEDAEWLAKVSWHAVPMRQTCKDKFYAARGSDSRYMHRVIIGAESKQIVDHIDGDTLNNRRSNLRLCVLTYSHNLANAQKRNVAAVSSRYKGVSLHRRTGLWRAAVQLQGRRFYLGYFRCEFDAAKAYDTKARELFGAFARTNFEGEA